MADEYTQLTNIFNFLLMREAHELGMIDDKSWSQFIEMLLPDYLHKEASNERK